VSKYSGIKTFTHSAQATVELHNIALFYVISILTLRNYNIDFANVKISNRCAYDLRLSCTFVADTLLNLPTPFNIILQYLNQHIPRKRLQASSCSFQFAGLSSSATLKIIFWHSDEAERVRARHGSHSSMVDPDPHLCRHDFATNREIFKGKFPTRVICTLPISLWAIINVVVCACSKPWNTA